MKVLDGYSPDGTAPDGFAKRIHAYSRHIIPLASDMPDSEYQVGYAFTDMEIFTPPEDLCEFLSQGPKPIYVGFGSMPGIHHESVSRTLIGVLERTDLRAVVATGWGGIRDMKSNAQMHILKAVPHPWLFPQVKAVVHQGGSGTTHDALR